jgi:hypothetical protein
MVDGRIGELGEEWVQPEGISDHRWSMVGDRHILAKISKCRGFPTKLVDGRRSTSAEFHDEAFSTVDEILM